MDYLTILSTRSLILFPDASAIVSPTTNTNTKPAHNRTYSSSSSASLSTPTSSHLLLPPTPISIPLTSLIYGDTSTAYFLIQHVLTSIGAISHTSALDHDHDHDESAATTDAADADGAGVALAHALGYGYGLSGLGANVSKGLMAEAEVLVWKEMDKAKMFVRELGASFGKAQTHGQGQGVRTEKGLMELAGKHGLALRPLEHQDHGHEHEHGHENEHAHNSVVDGVGKLSLAASASSSSGKAGIMA